MSEPFSTRNLSVRLANALASAGLTTPGFGGDVGYAAEQFVAPKVSGMTEHELLKVKNIGRRSLEELRKYGLIPPADGEVGPSPELVRMAAIGREVIAHLMGDNPRAYREATPELVVAYLQRREDERRAAINSTAMGIGEKALALMAELRRSGL